MQTDKEKIYGGVNKFVVDLKVILDARKHPLSHSIEMADH